jgi:hypothetical protein
MKKKYLLYLSLGLSIFLAHNAYTNSGGAPSGNSGSPASNGNGCDRAGCHNGPAAAGQTVTISTNIPSAGFKEDSIYEITITADNNGTGTDRMGFSASVESASGHEGTITISDAARTRKLQNYITHTFSGISGSSGVNTWSFDWNAGQAPDQTTVYASVNFANQNGNTSGDVIVNQSLSLDKNLGIGTGELDIVKVAAYPNPASDIVYLASDQKLELPISAISGNGQVFELEAKAIDAQHYSLAISNLPSGVYLIRDAANHQVRITKQ